MSNTKVVIGTIAGFVTGSLVTFLVDKARYKKKLIKELNECRDTVNSIYKERLDEKKHRENQNEVPDEVEDTAEPDDFNEDDVETLNFKTKTEYVDYTQFYKKNDDNSERELVDNPNDEEINLEPRVIDPYEYGAIMRYEQIHLSYYSDGILADDDNNIYEEFNWPNTVGADFMDSFGDYEENCVCIRNDALECEYEIERESEPFYGNIV